MGDHETHGWNIEPHDGAKGFVDITPPNGKTAFVESADHALNIARDIARAARESQQDAKEEAGKS